jgi:hypothetical protein
VTFCSSYKFCFVALCAIGNWKIFCVFTATDSSRLTAVVAGCWFCNSCAFAFATVVSLATAVVCVAPAVAGASAATVVTSRWVVFYCSFASVAIVARKAISDYVANMVSHGVSFVQAI